VPLALVGADLADFVHVQLSRQQSRCLQSPCLRRVSYLIGQWLQIDNRNCNGLNLSLGGKFHIDNDRRRFAGNAFLRRRQSQIAADPGNRT